MEKNSIWIFFKKIKKNYLLYGGILIGFIVWMLFFTGKEDLAASPKRITRSPDRHGSQSRWPRWATRYNASTWALDPEGTTLNPPEKYPATETKNEENSQIARCYARDKTRHGQTPSPEGGSSFWGRFHI